MPFHVYILRTATNKLYIGQTNNIKRRLNDHQNKHGAKFIKDYGSFELIYIEEFETTILAMKRETQLKKWTRAKKEALVSGDLALLKKL